MDRPFRLVLMDEDAQLFDISLSVSEANAVMTGISTTPAAGFLDGDKAEEFARVISGVLRDVRARVVPVRKR